MSSISISRNGEALGNWNAADIQRMLQSGVLSTSDYFWQDGMAEWSTLESFVRLQPTVETFPVTFGSAWAVDQLGFVRAGEIKISSAGIEYVGPRLWPSWMRVPVFLVATVVGWFILGSITSALGHAIPRDSGAVLYLLMASLGLFTLLGTPLLILTLIPYFCASASKLLIERAAISEVKHRGCGVTFLTASPGGKPRRARFRVVSAVAATRIAQSLGDRGRSNPSP